MRKNFSSFEAGDVVVAEFTYSNQLGAKQRPGLVISPTRYNAISNDLVLLKITSILTDRPFSLKLNQTDLKEGELRKESMTRIDFPIVVEKSVLKGRIGRVTAGYLEQVKKRVREFYE